MARVARIVLPGVPHHVTQRGNRRMNTFFRDSDYVLYRNLMYQWCERFSVGIEAYCLMPNHVHLVLVPQDSAGLSLAISEIHRRYTSAVNQREGWIGHLWQGRFFSVPLDDKYFEHAVRYVELNPVRAGLVEFAEEYEWSSASQLERESEFYDRSTDLSVIRKMTTTGRPVGRERFYERILSETGVDVRLKKRGRRGSNERSGPRVAEISKVSPI